jgi:hypothetical protein
MPDRLTIVSSFTQQEWTGEMDLAGTNDAEKLESAYRTFNRESAEDSAYLESVGFRQPSMSAGDRVILNGTAYMCEPLGFSPDTRDPHEPLNPWPLANRK